MYNQNDLLLLADVCERFRAKYLKIYKFDSAHFISASGLTWQAVSRNTKVQLELSSDTDKLLMVRKSIRSRKCLAILWYAEAYNKYMKVN